MAQALTVLFVDDEEEVRAPLAELVRVEGFRVFEAHSASEALRVLSQEHVDLLFTDLVMPEVDGIELAERARQMRPDIHVLFATGYLARAVTADKLGKVLFKPVRSKDVLGALSEMQEPSDAAVRATIEKFFTAFNSGNAAAELWRADAVGINVNGMISGKARLDERLANQVKLGLKLEHKIDRIDVDGPIAWAVGPYTVTIPSKDGGSTQSNGAWLQVLKQEAGAWKFQAVSFTRVNHPEKE